MEEAKESAPLQADKGPKKKAYLITYTVIDRVFSRDVKELVIAESTEIATRMFWDKWRFDYEKSPDDCTDPAMVTRFAVSEWCTVDRTFTG